MSSVNNFSPQLREAINKARPKRDQTFWFVSKKPGRRGTTVLPFDTIWDPWAVENEDGSFEGRMVDIAYLTSSVPAWGLNKVGSLKDITNLGRIHFAKLDGGRLPIIGGNPTHERLFDFLFLTSQVENTKTKEWYAPKAGRSPACYMQEPDKTDDEKLDFNRKVRAAGDLIDSMPEGKLRELAIGLEMPKYNKFTSVGSIKVYLLGIANSKPDKIMTLDKDESLKIKTLVKAALKHGIIVQNSQLGVYEWPENGDRICVIPPGEKAINAITNYLLGKGSKTREYISNLVAAKEDDSEKNKGGRPQKEK